MAKSKPSVSTAEPRPANTQTIEISRQEYEHLLAAKKAINAIWALPVGSWIGRPWYWTKGVFDKPCVFPNVYTPEAAALLEPIEEIENLARAVPSIHMHGQGERDAEIGRSVRNLPHMHGILCFRNGDDVEFFVADPEKKVMGSGSDPLNAFRMAGLWDLTPAEDEEEKSEGGNS